MPLCIIPMFFHWMIFIKKYGKISMKNENPQIELPTSIQPVKIKNVN